jgi:chaperonin GroES
MAFQPLNGNVLLRQIEPVKKTTGGLYIPDSAQDAPAEGIVEALPPGELEVAIGDRVIYKKFAGEEISVDGEKLRIVPQGDLLAKFVEADAIPAP